MTSHLPQEETSDFEKKHEGHDHKAKILVTDENLAKTWEKKFSGFKSDACSFAMMHDFFLENNIKGPWKRHLDIGGAEGFHAGFFKAHGLSKYSEALDIRTFSKENVKNSLFYFRFLLETLFIKLFIGSTANVRAHKHSKFGINFHRRSAYLNFPWLGLPIVDKMSQEDIYDKNEKYDIITAFLCLEYFDFDKVLTKVSEMLNDGGVFYLIVNYWWYPVNSTEIVGKVPYASQRMDFDEFQKYFSEHFPDEVDEIVHRYKYFHKGKHPVLNDYINKLDDLNLKMIATKRITPNLMESTRTAMTPRKMQQYKDMQLREVLKDIKRFRKDVELIDLHTGWVMGAFQKITPE